MRAGRVLYRSHRFDQDAISFARGRGKKPRHRFDDPPGEFGVCYLGESIDVCFAETFLRNPPVRILTLPALAQRRIATVALRRDLRLVRLHGPGLARIGATAENTHGHEGGYETSQTWSRALWGHPDQPDGIGYGARHDDSELCVALYDRARDAIQVTGESPLDEDPARLMRLLRRYGIALTR